MNLSLGRSDASVAGKRLENRRLESVVGTNTITLGTLIVLVFAKKALYASFDLRNVYIIAKNILTPPDHYELHNDCQYNMLHHPLNPLALSTPLR